MMVYLRDAFRVYVFGLLVRLSQCELTATDVRSEKLAGYDPKISPTPERYVKVSVGLIINHFSLEDLDNLFVANVWFTFTWTDPRLSWNQSETNSSFILRFGTEEIWKPDITLINSAIPTDTDHYGDVQLTVESDGKVTWSPPARLVSHCAMKMLRWPYDEHICTLKIGSWTHSGVEITLESLPSLLQDDPNHAIDRNLFVPNSEFTLVSSNVETDSEYYRCCQFPYAVVNYTFRLQRNSPSYVATVVLPIIVISFIQLMVFFLPPTAGEKITLAATNFLILCIFLVYFEARLPPLGDHLPLLVVLYGINLVLVGISLIVSVIVINISRNRKASSPPHCLRMFCNADFAHFLGLGYLVPYVSQTHTRLDEGVEMRSPRENGRAGFNSLGDKDDHTTSLVVADEPPYMVNADWILVASMIDRLTLIIYLAVSGISMGLCLS